METSGLDLIHTAQYSTHTAPLTTASWRLYPSLSTPQTYSVLMEGLAHSVEPASMDLASTLEAHGVHIAPVCT